eukprot:5968810-Alexandrium_andersonii.AAC.1
MHDGGNEAAGCPCAVHGAVHRKPAPKANANSGTGKRGKAKQQFRPRRRRAAPREGREPTQGEAVQLVGQARRQPSRRAK